MDTEPTMLEWLSLSGIAAVVGGIFGYGKLHGKIATHETAIAKLQQDGDTLARLDERVLHIKSDIADIKEQLRVFSK
jgi:hypothetical protein